MTRVFAVFHLNLAYSSVSEAQRGKLIEQCYLPLLDLVEETELPIGIELSGWTLQQLALLCPDWVVRFRTLLAGGKCELIGSGYVQLIGPLVPAEVNDWNQQLGMTCYQQELQLQPHLALVNEMAYAEGLLPIYQQAGYHGLVMDADNVRLALGGQVPPPAHACDAVGNQLPVLWTDSILFQKFQRYVHGEINLDEYLVYFKSRQATTTGPLCVYCNDVEVFGFRPGRFITEAPLHDQDEWQRVRRLLAAISELEVDWLSPVEALQTTASDSTCYRITSAAYPVPVKKQPKYNLGRWAISGRNDLALNSACYREYQRLQEQGMEAVSVRRLCENWASDYRTHIGSARWQPLKNAICHQPTDHAESRSSSRQAGDVPYYYSHDGMVLHVDTEQVQLALNLRRGLSIRSLAFAKHDFVPLLGTQLHGFFDAIALGADFYSGNLVAEYNEEPYRITDLDWVNPSIQATDRGIVISAEVAVMGSVVHKTVLIPRGEKRIQVGIAHSGLLRRRGSVRVAAATMLTQNMRDELWYETVNGGYAAERFSLQEDFDQGRAVSSQVSCTTGLGATEGWVRLGDRQHAITIRWDPGEAALFPLLSYQQASPSPFLRLSLSLLESDDTFVAGDELPAVSYWIEAD